MATTDAEARTKDLSARLHKHGRGRKPEGAVERQRHSIWLDIGLMERVGDLLLDVNYQLKPEKMSKAVFLERVIEYGLGNLDSIFEGYSPPSDNEQDS